MSVLCKYANAAYFAHFSKVHILHIFLHKLAFSMAILIFRVFRLHHRAGLVGYVQPTPTNECWRRHLSFVSMENKQTRTLNRPMFHANSVKLRTPTTVNRKRRWNRSRTSLHDIWNRLCFSNFLNTLPFSSTNWYIHSRCKVTVRAHTDTYIVDVKWQYEHTLTHTDTLLKVK